MSSVNMMLLDQPATTFAEKHLPRLVVGADGCVAYASEGFEQLIHAVPYSLEQSYLQDLITFVTPDDALRGGPMGVTLGVGGAALWTAAIREGTYPVYLRGRGKEIFCFRFDWVNPASGVRHLMLSLNEEAEASHPSAEGLSAYDLALPKDEEEDLLIDEESEHIAFSASSSTASSDLRRIFAGMGKSDGAPRTQGSAADAQFQDLSDDVMMVVEGDGRLRQVNPAFFMNLGYRPAQIPILNLMDLVADEDKAHVRSCVLDLVHQPAEVPVTIDLRLHRANKTSCDLQCRLRAAQGSVYILGRDLSEQKTHETKLLRQKQQLAEAEAIAHMGYWRWEIGAQVLEWSDEIYRILGKEPGKFIPTMDAMRGELRRSDRARMAQMFQRAMIERGSYEMDFTLTLPENNVRYIRCEGRCEQDDTGDVVALYGILQDMTSQTLATRELREAKNAAERAYESKSKFLANMSHELRTPLNAIIGFSEVMQRQLLGPVGTPRYLEYIDGIRQSGEHLLDLISDILDMSKIEAGKFQLDPEDIHMSKLSRLAVNMVEGRAREAGVRLVCDAVDDDVHLMADRRAILQIMLNLLSNAIKFTPEGGTVMMSLKQSGGRVTYRVADTGIGIPEDKLAVIACPFEQVANEYTRAHEGSGLGLAITKELCLMHNGHMDIQSAEGAGTAVTITLPMRGYEEE